MNYTNYYTVTMVGTPEPMPSAKDIYTEGGLKCKSISNMERILDCEAKTKFKEEGDKDNV